jgi:FtsH-binding integral membrane protein
VFTLKKYLVMAILGLLLGVTSPLPIWPGPLFLRYLPPGVISAVLIILACLGVMKRGSKIVGVIAIVYGVLAILAGVTFTYVVFAVRSEGLAVSGIISVGAVICLIVGIVVLILGYKTFKTREAI